MTTKELMIGDWVMYDPNTEVDPADDPMHVNEPPYPIRLERGEDLEMDGLGPVTLTQEILKKNGWRLRNTTNYVNDYAAFELFCYRDGYFDVEFYVYKDCCVAVATVATISSVHELQHIMRVCGIEKEIEL